MRAGDRFPIHDNNSQPYGWAKQGPTGRQPRVKRPGSGYYGGDKPAMHCMEVKPYKIRSMPMSKGDRRMAERNKAMMEKGCFITLYRCPI